MPEFKKELNISQLFNFKKDQQVPVGVINTLKIGETDFLPDMTVSDPSSLVALKSLAKTKESKAGLPIVAGLTSVSWDLGDTNPVKLEGYVGVRNKQKMNGLLYSQLIDINLTIHWTIFDYDPLRKKYFVCFASGGFTSPPIGAAKTALISRESNDLKITITDELCADVNSPRMFKFSLDVVPSPAPQELSLAASEDDKVTKIWGRLGPT